MSLCSKAPACALIDGEIRSEDPRLPHIREKITSQIHKTALGAESLVPFEFYEDINDWIKENQRTENLPIIALEQSKDSVMLSEFNRLKNLRYYLAKKSTESRRSFWAIATSP